MCRSLTPEKMCSGNLSDYLIKRASAFALTIEPLVSYIKAMVSCCSERGIRESFRKNFNLISLPAQKSFPFHFCSEFIQHRIGAGNMLVVNKWYHHREMLLNKIKILNRLISI